MEGCEIRYDSLKKCYYIIENYMYLPNSFLYNNIKDVMEFNSKEEFMEYVEKRFKTINSKYSDRFDFRNEKYAQGFIDWWESVILAKIMVK